MDTDMLCIIEMGAWGGDEASDGNRTHSFGILMRCGADSTDAEVGNACIAHNLYLCSPVMTYSYWVFHYLYTLPSLM